MVLMKQAVEAENNMLMVYNSPARILRVFMVEMWDLISFQIMLPVTWLNESCYIDSSYRLSTLAGCLKLWRHDYFSSPSRSLETDFSNLKVQPQNSFGRQ